MVFLAPHIALALNLTLTYQDKGTNFEAEKVSGKIQELLSGEVPGLSKLQSHTTEMLELLEKLVPPLSEVASACPSVIRSGCSAVRMCGCIADVRMCGSAA